MDEEPAFALPLAGWLRLRRGTASDAPAVARLPARELAVHVLRPSQRVLFRVETPRAQGGKG